jgi:hypothetical protein
LHYSAVYTRLRRHEYLLITSKKYRRNDIRLEKVEGVFGAALKEYVPVIAN